MQQNDALFATKRDIFEQQAREHERKATEMWESPIVGFGHALLAAGMRKKLALYDANKGLIDRTLTNGRTLDQ